MTIVIGLLGPAGAGKTSVAQHLVEKYGARRYSFAKPLKDMVGRALDFTHDQMWGSQAQKEAIDPRYGHSPRWFLQRIGTEGCRKTFGENFWVDQSVAQVRRDAPAIAVFDDARFKTEADAIRGYTDLHNSRGVILRLESPDRETEADASHASEREWADCEYDFLVKPAQRGLELLFGLVDEGCRHLWIPSTIERQQDAMRDIKDDMFPQRRELGY